MRAITHTPETRAEALRLLKGGLPPHIVRDRLGVSYGTLRRWKDPEEEERQRVASRAWKRRATGVCEDCGGPTRYNGRGRAVSAVCASCQAQRQRDARRWTHETVVAAIQLWAAEHDGRPPVATDWNHTGRARRFPALTTVYRNSTNQGAPFATWADAIEAAGFPRPHPGIRTPEGQGRMILAQIVHSPSAVEDYLRRESADGVAPSSMQNPSIRAAACRYFGSWEDACRRVGVKPRGSRVDHDEIIRLALDGLSYGEIAARVGCHRLWAGVVCRRAGINRGRGWKPKGFYTAPEPRSEAEAA